MGYYYNPTDAVMLEGERVDVEVLTEQDLVTAAEDNQLYVLHVERFDMPFNNAPIVVDIGEFHEFQRQQSAGKVRISGIYKFDAVDLEPFCNPASVIQRLLGEA